jgi:hypothetical protein
MARESRETSSWACASASSLTGIRGALRLDF